MNSGHHKTIFSKRLGCLVAVGEHASSQGKANGAASGQFSGFSGTDWLSTVLQFVGVLTASCAMVSLAWAGPAATALPTGGQVAQGAVSVQQAGAVMSINQSTSKAVVNWNTFDIGQNAKVNIVQPGADAVMLNRVTSANPSQILGQLNADGQVVLVNPNGVLFGKDGSVNASSFTASTLGISDANFMAGNHQFERNGSTAAVVNQGSISTTGGYVALLGASVSNEGKIETQGGTAYLAAAETVKIPVSGSGRIKLELSPSRINAAVANGKTGTFVTEGGQVYMQAASLSTMVASIIQSGNIDTTGEQGGAVHLLADGGQIKVDGSITANSTAAQNKGGDIVIGRDEETGVLAKATDVSGAKLESQKGFVETSGDWLATYGTRVKAKDWLLDPVNINIAGTASGTGYSDPNVTGGSYSYEPTTTSTILNTDIQNSLNDGTNVKITTGLSGSTGGDEGNITVSAAIVKSGSSDANLTLEAYNGITVNQRIGKASNDTTSTGKLDVSMNANGGIAGGTSKGITLNNVIDANGGVVTLTGTNRNAAGRNANSGVVFNNNSGITSGSFVIKGYQLGLASASNIDKNGIYFNGASTLKSTGPSSLEGTSNSQGNLGAGIYAESGANLTLDSGATGTMHFAGGNSNPTYRGVRLGGTSNATINVKGNVSFEGTDANASAKNGVFLRSNVTQQSGSTLNLRGASVEIYVGTTVAKATGATNTTLNLGDLTPAFANGSVNIGSGGLASLSVDNINIVGNTSTAGQQGVLIQAGSTLTANNIFVKGSALGAADKVDVVGSATAKGIHLSNGILNATNNITLDGTSTNVTGVALELGSVTSSGGAVVIAATTTAGVYQGANIGVAVSGKSVSITGNSTNERGVSITKTVTSTGGDIDIDGRSSSGNGVQVDAAISSTGGKVDIYGQSTMNNGVFIANSLTSNTDNIFVEGESKSGSASAVRLQGAITASLNVNIEGKNTTATNGATSLYVNKAVIATNGKIDVTAKTAGTTSNAVQLDSGANLTGKTEVNVITDTLSIVSGATINSSAPTGKVTIKTDTAVTKIDIGNGTGTSGVDSGSGTRTLGLSNAELNRISAGELVIGNASNTGGLKVSAATTTNTTTGNLTLQTSGGMSISGALTAGNTTLKNITLLAKSSGTGLLHQAKVKGDNITMQAESTATTVDILGYYGAGSGAQFEAAKSLHLTGITASTGNGFYNIGGTYTAGTGIAIKGTSANGQGVGLDQNVNITNTTGDIIVTGTATNTSNNTATTGVHTEGIALRGSKITNKGGSTKLTAVNGNVFTAPGTWAGSIPNEIINSNTSTGIVQITSGNTSDSNSGGVNGTALTITQNGTGGVLVSSSGTGNITAPKIVNAGSGDVVIAAGTQIAAGDGSGGQLKTVSDNTITQNSSGKTYLYTGNANDTGALLTVGGFTNGLFLSTIGADTVNAASNTAYETSGTRNTVSGGATTQVMFREKVAMQLTNGASISHIYGDANTKNDATAKSALWSEMKNALGAANSGNITNSTIAGIFKITGAALVNDLTEVSLSSAGYSTSGYLNYASGGYNYGAVSGNNYTTTMASGQVAKVTMSQKSLGANIADVQATYGTSGGTGSVALTGVSGADNVSAGSASLVGTALSSSGNLKAGTYVQSVGGGLSGADAGNYTFSGTSSANYVVNKLALNTQIAGVTTTYGTAAATGAASMSGVIAGDKVDLGNAKATLVNAVNSSSGNLKAGTYQQTVANGLSGADAANYTAAPTSLANYVVTPKAIAATVTAADKVYDGNNVATLNANSAGILTGDVVNVLGATGTFASKNVSRDGAGNVVAQTVTVTGTGVGLGGTDGANYTLTNATSIASTTAKISPKDLSVSGITASDKVYDGSTTATIDTANAVISGLVTGDSVSVSTQSGVGNFASKDVAFDGAGVVVSQAVTVSGLSLNGASAVNYNVSDKSGASAKVLQRALSITGSVAQDKTVDGNTNAQVKPGQLVNLVAGESLVVSATGQFADAEIGTNKAVITQYALANGANGTARNYTLAGEVLRAAILVASINPVQPIVNPSRTGGGGRVVVSGSGNSGAALGVADGEEEIISRKECSVLNPEKCECQESTIAGVEMCFAPTLAANTKN